MPAPNGPRQGISTGRNRRTVQNISSKGGNIYTALQRDRQTGLGGQLNKAPKPKVQTKQFTPTESLKKLKEIRTQTTANLNTTLPTASTAPKTSSIQPYLAAQQGRANITAMALLAKMAQHNQGGTKGGNTTPAGGVSGLQALAQRMAARQHGWGGNKQWQALQELVQRESSWNPKADNPTSTAYGLFQFLDSTRENYGLGLNAKPRKQIKAGLQYIADRYGNPRKALRFHDRNNWY